MGIIVLIITAKGFAVFSELKLIPSGSRHCPYQPLFVKTCADYVIPKLMDSMHVNFSQLEHFVCTRFKFYV